MEPGCDHALMRVSSSLRILFSVCLSFPPLSLSLPVATDQLLKEFVSTQFASCTVLTIAHRLNTILDSDRILVFDHGRLVEFDTPKRLLRDRNGFLAGLVRETNQAGKIHEQHERAEDNRIAPAANRTA